VPTDSDPPPEFVSLKQINAGELSVGYAELGSANGAAVFLLHGWPYDIHSFADAAPLLAAKGYRVIVPYVRGYGSTRFLSADTRLANACRSAAVQCLPRARMQASSNGTKRSLQLSDNGRSKRPSKDATGRSNTSWPTRMSTAERTAAPDHCHRW
jgi:pimeloyl-ACP methyl ester carboxylesterase